VTRFKCAAEERFNFPSYMVQTLPQVRHEFCISSQYKRFVWSDCPFLDEDDGKTRKWKNFVIESRCFQQLFRN